MGALTTTTPSHRLPSRAELERGLTPMAIQFCELRARGFSLRKAARLAGYQASSERNFTSIGYRLDHDERCVALMEHLGRQMVRAATPRAVGTLDTIMSDKEVSPADRTRAAKVLLDKSIPSVTHHEASGQFDHRHEHLHEHRVVPTMDDLRREAGMLPAAPAVDAEFEILEPADPAQTEGGDPYLRGGDDAEPDASEWSV